MKVGRHLKVAVHLKVPGNLKVRAHLKVAAHLKETSLHLNLDETCRQPTELEARCVCAAIEERSTPSARTNGQKPHQLV